MKKFLLLAALAVGLVACGEKVQVPPAHVGKILTPKGYEPDIIAPSVFRLDPCWTPGAICDKLVILETSDKRTVEDFKLLMPKDDLYLSFDMNIIYAIKNEEGTLNTTLDRLPPSGGQASVLSLSAEQIYQTYGRPILRDVVRAVLAQYSIDEIASSRDAINQEITKRLAESVSGSAPLAFKYAGLADVDYPPLLVQAKEQAAAREVAIQKEEAERAIRLVQIQTDLEAAEAERAVRITRAEGALQENEIIARSSTKEYLAYRQLEVLDNLAKSENVIFVPMSALDEVGLSQSIFNSAPRSAN